MGYRPTKRAGGNAGGQVYHSFNREIPRRAGESPGPACDSRNLLKHEDIWIRRRCPLADKARGKSVSVRGDEAKRPDAYDGNEVDLDVEGHGISAKLGGISTPLPSTIKVPPWTTSVSVAARDPVKGTCSLATAGLAESAIKNIAASKLIVFIC